MNLKELEQARVKVENIKYWEEIADGYKFEIHSHSINKTSKRVDIGKDTVLGREIKRIFRNYIEQLKAELKELGVDYD